MQIAPMTLGIDASMVRPGFVIIDQNGNPLWWHKPDWRRLDKAGRVQSYVELLWSALADYDVGLVSVESSLNVRPDFKSGTNGFAVDALPFSRGVIWATTAIRAKNLGKGIELRDHRVAEARRGLIGGYGMAVPSKEDAKRYLQLRQDLQIDQAIIGDHDLVDAMVIALWGQVQFGYERTVQSQGESVKRRRPPSG